MTVLFKPILAYQIFKLTKLLEGAKRYVCPPPQYFHSGGRLPPSPPPPPPPGSTPLLVILQTYNLSI